jgi:hypothetical protein
MKEILPQVKLLPNRYKRFAFWIMLGGLPLLGGFSILLLQTGLVTDEQAFFEEWNYPMVYYPVVIGMALLVFSEEKEEDEMVQSLRYKAFVSGVYYLVIGLVMLPFYFNLYTLFVRQSIRMPDVGGMLGALILLLVYIYGSFRYNLYQTRKALETDAE